MQSVRIRFHSSLEKLAPHTAADGPPVHEISGLWGETVSLQFSACFAPDYFDDCYTVLSVECPGCRVAVYRQEQVPCTFPCLPGATGDYLLREPGLVSDPLLEYSGQAVRLNPYYSQLFWVDVTIPEGAPDSFLRVSCSSRKGVCQAEQTLPLHVVPVSLPPQTARHTEWFYADCLCQQYGCAMFSDEFFVIARQYIQCAAEHGVDTLLTPIFTPSLDIERGQRRMPGQLVRITRNARGFSFDFSLLERWVQNALDCGIRWFEVAPFFTQWGAECAAEIYLDTPQGQETLFGWETPALSPAYAEFLASFLPHLIRKLEQLGIRERTFFHISDEPSEEHLENYRRARSMIEPYLDGCPIIDALSCPSFYRQGLVSIPVVAEDHLAPFLAQERTGPIWTYSCCCQDKLVPNVFLAMPSVRGRILGVLMYQERLDGFLRWGYNFWNSQFSKEPVDPYRTTDAGLGFPSGDGFLVYPGQKGRPVPSIRLKLLRDAFQDMRALFVLEQQIGRAGAMQLIQACLGRISFTEYSSDATHFEEFRQKLNKAITQQIHSEEKDK